jgi:arylsulfatase A-like enzyme
MAYAGAFASCIYASVGFADSLSHSARPSQMALASLAYAIVGYPAAIGAFGVIRATRWATRKPFDGSYEGAAAAVWAVIGLLAVYGVVWLNRYVLVDYPWFSPIAMGVTVAFCAALGAMGLMLVPAISRGLRRYVDARAPALRHGMRLFPLVLIAMAAANFRPQKHAFEARSADRDDLPNIVVLVSDCVRADHVSAYGYELHTTPLFDRVAAEGVLFEDAHASASWTLPSVTGILASVRAGIDVKPGVTGTELDSRTLPEVLRDLGYATYAVSNNPHLGGRFGIGSRFDTFDGGATTWQRALDATLAGVVRQRFLIDDGAIVSRAIEALGDLPEPFFLYLHVMGGHAPYEHPRSYEPAFPIPSTKHPITGPHSRMEISEEQRANLVARYDVMIRYADDQLQRFADALAARDLLDDTLLIYTADHGEEFGEHGGWTHGRTLHVESIRVPLAVRWPGHVPANTRRTDLVSLVDLGPSILGALPGAAVKAPGEWQGVNLQWTTEAPALGPHVAISEHGPALRALITPQWKYVVDVTTGSAQLYDRLADPGEGHDLAAEKPEVVQRLADLLDAEIDGQASALQPTRHADPATPALVEQLRALGYVE